jgi:galactosylxylosylprotein 3-beta-galactosyltransferase
MLICLFCLLTCFSYWKEIYSLDTGFERSFSTVQNFGFVEDEILNLEERIQFLERENMHLKLQLEKLYNSNEETNVASFAKPHFEMVIGILSSPSNHRRRSAARNTWMKLLSNSLKNKIFLKFFIGKSKEVDEKKLQEEKEAFQDIVLLDFEEDYSKLLLKTLRVFQWCENNIEFDLFMKTDDDSFIRVDLLLDEMRLRIPRAELIYLGFMHNRSFVHRQETSKFYEPHFEDCQTYLPYASGAGYILSNELVRYLAWPPLPLRHFRNEDVGIGFLLSTIQKRNIHETRFHPEREGSGESLCPIHFLLQHHLDPEEFYWCFNLLLARHSATAITTQID